MSTRIQIDNKRILSVTHVSRVSTSYWEWLVSIITYTHHNRPLLAQLFDTSQDADAIVAQNMVARAWMHA